MRFLWIAMTSPAPARPCAQMRTVPSNRKTIGFAIVNGVTTLQQAFEMGANFVSISLSAPNASVEV